MVSAVVDSSRPRRPPVSTWNATCSTYALPGSPGGKGGVEGGSLGGEGDVGGGSPGGAKGGEKGGGVKGGVKGGSGDLGGDGDSTCVCFNPWPAIVMSLLLKNLGSY